MAITLPQLRYHWDKKRIKNPNSSSYKPSIEIIHGGKRLYITLPVSIPKEHFTKECNLKNKKLKLELQDILLTLQRRVLTLGYDAVYMTAEEVRDYITSGMNKETSIKYELDVIAWWEKYVEKSKAPQNCKWALGIFKQYVGEGKLDASNITLEWVDGYMAWLGVRYKVQNTVDKLISVTSTTFEACMEDANKKVRIIKENPFPKAKKPVLAKVSKKRAEQGIVALRPEIVKMIMDLDCSMLDDDVEFARDICTISFYLCGINFSDIVQSLELEEIYNPKTEAMEQWVRFTRSKTKDRTHLGLKFKVEPELAKLIEKYKPKGVSNKAFNFYQRFTSQVQATAKLGYSVAKMTYQLVKIHADKHGLTNEQSAESLGLTHFTFYAMRRSWASIAYNQCGIEERLIDRCMCHTSNSVLDKHYILEDYTNTERAKLAVMNYIRNL